MSSSNLVALRLIEETTWGSLPSTPTMAAIRYTGESLITEVQTIASNEIRDSRAVADSVQVSRQISGGMDFELSFATFDTLLEGAFCGDWTTNVLKGGSVKHSYSIEKALTDIDEYFLFTGMMVNTFGLTLATQAMATGNFSFLGSAATLAQTSNATSVTAANTNSVMNCMGNVASLREGATLTAFTGIYVQELSFTLNNNLRPVHAIGANTIQEIAMGKQDVTGSLNCYFTSDRLFDKFLAQSETAIDFQITDGTNTYTVLFPRVKFETDSVVSSGQDTDVIENLTWRALYDDTEATCIKITRSS